MGGPSDGELALLEPLRGQVRDTVFGEAVTPPVSDGSGRDRKLLRQATELLKEAGWTRGPGGLVDASGEQLTIEFLINSPVFEIILGKYVEGLKLIGIEATIRIVDAAQFQRRLLDFDFDVVGRASTLSPVPIEDVPTMFHSRTVNEPGSTNYSGIDDPAVDAMLDAVSRSKTPEELTIAMARARPGASRRPSYGPQLVQPASPRGALGHVRLSRDEARFRLPVRDHMVARRRKSRGDRTVSGPT